MEIITAVDNLWKVRTNINGIASIIDAIGNMNKDVEIKERECACEVLINILEQTKVILDETVKDLEGLDRKQIK